MTLHIQQPTAHSTQISYAANAFKKGHARLFLCSAKMTSSIFPEGHSCYGVHLSVSSCWLKCTPQKAFLIHCGTHKLMWELKAWWPWQFRAVAPQHLYTAQHFGIAARCAHSFEVFQHSSWHVCLNAVIAQLYRHCLLPRHTVNHSNAEEAHLKVAEHLSLQKQVQLTAERGSEVRISLYKLYPFLRQ